MTEILLIDANIRTASRTRELTYKLLEKLSGNVTTLKLSETDIPQIDEKTLDYRAKCSEEGDFSSPLFSLAKQFKLADIIVISAPFWDNSFPAILKKYIESICVANLTFKYGDDGIPIGLCNAKYLYYVTTAGGMIYNDAFSYGYIESISKGLFGIKNTKLFKAENLDIIGNDVTAIIDSAKREIDENFK